MTTVTGFSSAEAFLAGGRSKFDRPIENNTRIVVRGDGRARRIAVMLHSTDVVTFHPDGSVTLDSGGWLTVTTKDRINRYIGDRGRVYSKRGVWYVFTKDGGTFDWDGGVRFFDGIRVAADGTILNPRSTEADERQTKAEEAMKRRIRKFVDAYMKALAEGMPVPSGGDCWDCAFVTDDGKSMGDLKDDQIHGHLFSHMTEKYLVPTLIWNAVRDKGYRDPQFVMGMRLDTDAYSNEGTMRVRREWNATGPDKYALRDLRQDLTKYLVKRLIPSRAH